MKKLIYLILFTVLMSILSNCRPEACQNPPPPDPAFVLLRRDFTPVLTEANASSLEIRYEDNGVKQSLTNFKILKTKGGITKFTARDFLQNVYQNKPFSISLEGKVLGNLYITTRRNNTECDNWINMELVRFENSWASKISDDPYDYYLVFVE